MKNRNPKPLKKFSQVFLDRSETLEGFVGHIDRDKYKKAIEIGPGPGFLTKALLEAGLAVDAFELDERMVEHLSERFPAEIEQEKLQVIHQDILRLQHGTGDYPEDAVLIGNIPYAISSAIVQWALSPASGFGDMYFMVQKEFGERLASEKGNKSYGSLSVYTQLRAKAKVLEFIPKEWFSPVPKVDSVYLHLQRDRKYSEEILKKSEMVSKVLFAQRRKKIRNGIKALCSTYKVAIEEIPADLELRPEQLEPESFAEIAKKFADPS
jgi:16S rRNA (adenine1518-N6/adenine1519-N6)-dimethyltransferase